MSLERLAEALSRSRVDERETALRALLMRPLMTASDPQLAAVRRHADYLRDWFGRMAGWTLRVERDCARLYKRPADPSDATRGIPGFDRRRYALLCLACALLERSEPQITLKSLGTRLLDLAADPELVRCGFQFTLESAHERRELVHVCRYLLELGVLHRVAGDEDSYVQHGGDALYDVHRRALAGILASTRGPSTLGTPAGPATSDDRAAWLIEEFQHGSEEGRRAAMRHRLARRLLDDPVVYFDELDADERDYFSNQRGAMGERLRLATGLVPEQRAEGMALVDPQAELTDAALPAEGTGAHATLLVAQYLAERSREGAQRLIPESEVAVFLRKAADEYGRYWRKAAREPGAEAELAREALGRLAALKLVRLTEAGVVARPALARFAIAQPSVRPPSQLELPA